MMKIIPEKGRSH